MLSGNNFRALQVQERERIGYTQATTIVWSVALKNIPIAMGITFVQKQC
jgi:hypothetical protein